MKNSETNEYFISLKVIKSTCLQQLSTCPIFQLFPSLAIMELFKLFHYFTCLSLLAYFIADFSVKYFDYDTYTSIESSFNRSLDFAVSICFPLWATYKKCSDNNCIANLLKQFTAKEILSKIDISKAMFKNITSDTFMFEMRNCFRLNKINERNYLGEYLINWKARKQFSYFVHTVNAYPKTGDVTVITYNQNTEHIKISFRATTHLNIERHKMY